MMDGIAWTERRRRERLVGLWLLGVAASIFVMVVLGGLTRLTGSGLSMVDWHPVTGWLPPLSETAWERAFADYRQYPQYVIENAGMTLAGFKEIYWLEYVHRLWGRVIGLAFAVPFALFLWRGWIDRRLAPKLAVLFVLGGLQGVLGWYMVKSGLVDRPDVSQYRLTAHLVSALLLLAASQWIALQLLFPDPQPAAPETAAIARGARLVLVLAAVTICAGGFVAGTRAGLMYNTYPLMDGLLLPPGLYGAAPWWRSVFEDPTSIQFDHRHLAETTALATFLLWGAAQRVGLAGRAGLAVNALALAVAAQAALGILTLLLIVPIWAAAMHQAGAVVVLGTAVWTVYELRLQGLSRPAVAPA